MWNRLTSSKPGGGGTDHPAPHVLAELLDALGGAVHLLLDARFGVGALLVLVGLPSQLSLLLQLHHSKIASDTSRLLKFT